MAHATAEPPALIPPMTIPPLSAQLRLPLSIMMFLQFAIWGSWFTVLNIRLKDSIGLGDWIGVIMGTMALGTIFTPLFIGAIADRYFSSERLMAVLHLAGAGLLYWMAQLTGHEPMILGRPTFFWVALLYALVYSPTLALANSIAFTHIPDATRDFPGIRVLGTIGWIAAGLAVNFVLGPIYANTGVRADASNGPLLMAAVLSLVLGAYSLVLPHTPPPGGSSSLFPAFQAIGLLRNWSFAVFFIISTAITIVLAFYYNYTGVFLSDHLKITQVAATLTIGQVSEMIILPFLPLVLWRWGIKWVLAVGMLAWGLRYWLFSYIGGRTIVPTFGDLAGLESRTDSMYWLVLFSLAFHGVCFDFFFAAGFIHVDNEARPEIRGSAQALFTFLTYGLAMWLGSELSNWYYNLQSVPGIGAEKVTNWELFWLLPSLGAFAALILFVLLFRLRRR